MQALSPTQAIRKEKKTLFSNHTGSLLRRQPAATQAGFYKKCSKTSSVSDIAVINSTPQLHTHYMQHSLCL